MCGRSDEEEVREKEKEKVDIAEEFASADEVDAAWSKSAVMCAQGKSSSILSVLDDCSLPRRNRPPKYVRRRALSATKKYVCLQQMDGVTLPS